MHGHGSYPSRIDGRLVLLMVAPLVSGLLVVGTIASRLPVLPGRGYILAALLGAHVLVLWVLLATRYTLDGMSLRVRSGPFSWVIPLKEIHAVSRTGDQRAAPALSLQRLRIDYGDGRAVMVSPREEVEFLADLRARGVPVGT
jgi:hypothetical protein